MLTYFGLKNQEIPEELLRVESVIDDKKNIFENELSSNDFFLAEKNAVPYHQKIPAFNILTSNNSVLCFANLEDELKKKSLDIERGKIDPAVIANRNIFSYFSELLGINKITDFFTFRLDGFQELSSVDMKEIKFFKYNSFGQISIAVNKNNLILISSINPSSGLVDTKLFNTKLSPQNNLEILDIQWHSVNKNIVAIIYKDNIILHRINDQLLLSEIKYINFKNPIKIKWDSSGEFAIIIYNSGRSFAVLDACYKTIYKKNTWATQKYIDVQWPENSSYFILFSSTSYDLYNMYNFNSNNYTDFQGDIIVNINYLSNIRTFSSQKPAITYLYSQTL